METENFEENLLKMSKPEVLQLKHQEVISSAIANAKDSSVLSWWWISVPLYLIAAFIMKSFFMPHSTMISGIQEFTVTERFSSVIFFLLIPAVFIVVNLFIIRRIYFLSGSPEFLSLIRQIWFNILIIILSILILTIFLI